MTEQAAIPPAIKCGHCSAEWTGKGLRLFNVSHDEDEDAEPEGFDASIEMTCQSCGRVMYREDGVIIDP